MGVAGQGAVHKPPQPPEPPLAQGKVTLMRANASFLPKENDPPIHVKLIASGMVNDALLTAREHPVRSVSEKSTSARQEKRPPIEAALVPVPAAG
jgi:hypothetical protein